MKLNQLYHTVQHLKPSQIMARAKLTLQRQLNQMLSVTLNRIYLNSNPSFNISKQPPKPIFKPRKGKFKSDINSYSNFRLTFLNQTQKFKYPLNWHISELDHESHLWIMNLHYMEYLEEVDNEWFKLLIEDWIRQNPPFRKAYWLYSWNSFSLSIRSVIWMQQISMRLHNLDQDFVLFTSKSVYKQLLFLEKNLELDIRGNHLIKNMKALFWGASFFEPDQNTIRWKMVAEKLLQSILSDQILSDGMHYERSPAYHCQVLADLLECHSVMEPSALRSKLLKILHKMGSVMTDLTHPDGLVSLFNDGALNMTYQPEELRHHIELVTRQQIKSSKSIELKDAGYYGLRNHGFYFLFDAGKIGPDELPAHGHGDIFSFELSVGNERIFVDKGVYKYSEGVIRDASRSTLSHNTLSIDRQDQCEFYGSFRVARRAEVKVQKHSADTNSLYIQASHNGYNRLPGKPIHSRAVKISKNMLLIDDSVSGGKGQKAEARFLLHPDVNIVRMDENHIRLKSSHSDLLFETDQDFELSTSEWFPDFGESLQCNQIIVYLGQVPCAAHHRIIFGK